MTKRIVVGILIGFIISMSLSACGPTGDLEESSSEYATDKYNKYVELSNFFTGWFDLVLYGYFEEFGVKEDIKIPEGYDGAGITPIMQGFYDDVDKAMEYASEKPSFGAADESIKALGPKVKELMDTANEIHTYYSTKSFADDDGAKGKELHKKISIQYTEYVNLLDKFRSDLRVISEERQMKELEDFKNGDYMIRYYAMSILMVSEDIEKLFYDENGNYKKSSEFEVSKFEEKYNSLKENVNKLMEVSKDDNRLKKEGLENNAFIGRFKEETQRVKASATDILQVLKDINEKNGSTGKVSIEGLEDYIEHFSREVSSAIASYNNMN